MLEGGVFKKLPKNDTGQAEGHQAGIVINRAISEFFPEIPDPPTPAQPTPGVRVEVDMYVDGDWIGKAYSSYHLETWGCTRLPGEIRLTDQLGPLRNQAKAGDIAVFVFDPEDDLKICLHLIRKGKPHFAKVEALTGRKKCGVLKTDVLPISKRDVATARQEIQENLTKGFELFSDERTVVESLVLKKVRAKAFRLEVLAAYGSRCAFSGSTMVTAGGAHGLDAAHIVPVEKRGTDHIGNGLALTKNLHWAFDHGLIGVDQHRRVSISPKASALSENRHLQKLHGKLIREPHVVAHRANSEALGWHWDNVFVK